MTGHSVRFDKNTAGDGPTHGSTGRLSNRRIRRPPYPSQQSLQRLNRYGSRTTSMYRLNHLSPQQKQSIGKSYTSLVHKKHQQQQYEKLTKKQPDDVPIDMEKKESPEPPKRGLYTNKHIASAHRLLSDIPDDEPSFKAKLRSVMNTYNFQILMVVLIILDCVMVLGEMIIELRLFQNEDCPHGHQEAAKQVANAIVSSTIGPLLQTTTVQPIVEHGGHESNVSGHGHEPGHGISAHDRHLSDCEHSAHLLHNVENVFHLTSIFILFLFNVELLVRLYSEGYKYFLHLEIALDALIVMVSFGLDIVFLDHKMKKYLYLLIILRVWRVLRVVHAIITAIRAPHERQIEKLKKKKKMLQRDLAKAYFYSNVLEEEIQNLREYIDSFEIIEEYDDDDLDGSRGYIEKIPVYLRSVQSEQGIRFQSAIENVRNDVNNNKTKDKKHDNDNDDDDDDSDDYNKTNKTK
ncbi:uncharacterized protein LOC124495884 [Dermatophagoides farinae]|uniref:uncharacterized protein LOC124495884 n=1 Tax=Dermatophagoides farinae TaxID=6954 RepID=UPI003F6178B9